MTDEEIAKKKKEAAAAQEDGDFLTFKNGSPRWGKIFTWAVILTVFICCCIFVLRPCIRPIVAFIEETLHMLVKSINTPLRWTYHLVACVCYPAKQAALAGYEKAYNFYHPYLVVS